MTRLIDADALMDDIRKHSESYFADDFAHIWVDKQPTVDAIPIEFIKSEIARMKEGLNPHHPECAIYAEDLGILIEEWEGYKKEDETD